MTHPGRTPAQRRALDAIGAGNRSPIMQHKVRDALLRARLIVLAGRKRVGTGPLTVWVDEFEMPPAVHQAWCATHGGGDA